MRVLNSLEITAVAGGYQEYTDNCGDGYTMVKRTHSLDISTTTNSYGSQTTKLYTVTTVCEETSGSGGYTSGGGYSSSTNYSDNSYGGGDFVEQEDTVANVMF